MAETTHEDLERAAEEATTAAPEEGTSEEEITTTSEEQQQTEEEKAAAAAAADHGESSRLGRKVKGMEDRLNQLMGKLDTLISNPGQTRTEERTYDPDESAPMTKGELYNELDRYNKDRETRQTKEAQEYEQTYVRKLTDLGWDMSEEDYNEIAQELHANHNVRRTGNAAVDAEINFEKAQNAILRKKMGEKKIPLKGEKVTNALGGPSNTTNTERAPAPIKLDDDAAAFAKYVGWGDEKVRSALSKDRLVGSKFPNIEEA